MQCLSQCSRAAITAFVLSKKRFILYLARVGAFNNFQKNQPFFIFAAGILSSEKEIRRMGGLFRTICKTFVTCSLPASLARP